MAGHIQGHIGELEAEIHVQPDFYAIFWKVHDSSEFCKNIMGCLLSYSEKACSVIPHTLQITTSYPEIQYLYAMLQDLNKRLKYK